MLLNGRGKSGVCVLAFKRCTAGTSTFGFILAVSEILCDPLGSRRDPNPSPAAGEKSTGLVLRRQAMSAENSSVTFPCKRDFLLRASLGFSFGPRKDLLFKLNTLISTIDFIIGCYWNYCLLLELLFIGLIALQEVWRK